jgi:hypothetical protein
MAAWRELRKRGIGGSWGGADAECTMVARRK